MSDDLLYQSLLTQIAEIRAVDSHAHLDPEAEHLTRPLDALTLFRNYAPGDLMTLGCPADVMERICDAEAGTIAERWEQLAPYWPQLRNGSYARLWERTVRELLGCPRLNAAGLEQATERLRELLQPGWYRELLRDRCNLEVCLLDRDCMEGPGCSLVQADGELIRPVVRNEDFLQVLNRADLGRLEERQGQSVHTLEDLAALQTAFLEDAHRQGAVGLKFGLAYRRSLLVENPTHQEAEACFRRLCSERGDGIGYDEAKPLQDWLLRRSLEVCEDLDMTAVFHTGLQAGGKNLLANSDPTLLNNLFLEYPRVRFDLFHAGFPYVRECGVLAKYFANVWADMAWAHFISQAGAQQWMLDWLDYVPAGKIIGFGADLGDVEMTWGALTMARENLAAVLAERVRRGYDTEEQAVDLARVMLREAPGECYRLGLS